MAEYDPLRNAYKNMYTRCYRKSCRRYAHYGGKGIRICDRWLKSYDDFVADMGPRPSPHHSIERDRTDGDYEPGNCRWATPSEQARNKTSNDMIEHNGEKLCLTDWAARYGMRQGTLWSRIYQRGMTFEQAITIPVGARKALAKAKQDAVSV